MRRLLRDIAEGKALGDTTTLADPHVVAKLKAEYEDKESRGGSQPPTPLARLAALSRGFAGRPRSNRGRCG